jgi:cobalamin biosynthesis protein CbiD
MTIGIVERRGIGYSRGQVAHNPKPKTKTKDEVLRYPERRWGA